MRHGLIIGASLACAMAFVASGLRPAVQAQASVAVVMSSNSCSAPTRSLVDNGIAVGDPKIFDNRSLALMLDTLNESLRTSQVIDLRSVVANLSSLQGFQQDSIQRSFLLQGAPTPGVVQTDTSNLQQVVNNGLTTTAGSTANTQVGTSTNAQNQTTGSTTTTQGQTTGSTTTGGDTTTATQGSTTQTTTAARSPIVPDLPAVLSAPAFTPQFGQNAADLLGDQLNLSYQIFNVRMLLERALTDRLANGEPRLQAVLGFNVSVDPRHGTQDSAAFVEVTVEPPTTATPPVSLVALMPQEKTYNSAALSNRSTAFGGSAVAQVFSVGYNERRQSQTFYLFRDNDTISFQRMTGASHQTQFGWAFRPVLGRRSVSPGSRQMFAVIAMPYQDTHAAEVALTVKVRTYWHHYDRRTLTTTDSRTFWQAAAHAFSLGLAQDRPGAVRAETTACVTVPTTARYQENLSPEITSLEWRQTDDRFAVVSVQGKNFFQGTSVRLGSAQYAIPTDGLTLKSDKAFDLTVPVNALLGTGVIAGRYGNAIDMLRPGLGHTGMVIQHAEFDPPAGGRRLMRITLAGAPGPLSRFALPGPAIVSLGGTIIPPPYDLSDAAGNTVVLQAYPSVEQVPTAEGLLTVRFPFAGDPWRSTFRIYDPSLAFSVTRFASEGPNNAQVTKLLVTTTDIGNLFDCGPNAQWRVGLGTDYPVQPTVPSGLAVGAGQRSPITIEMRLPAADLDKHPFLLIDCNSFVHRLTMPGPPASRPDPTTFGSPAPGVIKVNSAPKVVITGTVLDKVASVSADGLSLTSRSTDNGTKLEVFLIRTVTGQPGPLALIARDDKGAILGSVELTIQ